MGQTPPPGPLPETERGSRRSFSPSPLRGGGWGEGLSPLVLKVDDPKSDIVVAKVMMRALVDPVWGRGVLAWPCQQPIDLRLGLAALLSPKQEPLGQRVSHQQEPVAASPAATSLLRGRVRRWPRAEQARLVAEPGGGGQRERFQQAPAAGAEQATIADRQRSPGPRTLRAWWTKHDAEQRGEGALFSLDLRIPGQRQSVHLGGPALPRPRQPVEVAPGFALPRDEALDEQTRPGGGEGTLRGTIGNGEAAGGGVSGEGVLVLLLRMSALGKVERVPAGVEGVDRHGSASALGHAGAEIEKADDGHQIRIEDEASGTR